MAKSSRFARRGSTAPCGPSGSRSTCSYAVAHDVGALLAEQRHVAVGPTGGGWSCGSTAPCLRCPSYKHLGAHHQPPGEEHLRRRRGSGLPSSLRRPPAGSPGVRKNPARLGTRAMPTPRLRTARPHCPASTRTSSTLLLVAQNVTVAVAPPRRPRSLAHGLRAPTGRGATALTGAARARARRRCSCLSRSYRRRWRPGAPRAGSRPRRPPPRAPRGR